MQGAYLVVDGSILRERLATVNSEACSGTHLCQIARQPAASFFVLK